MFADLAIYLISELLKDFDFEEIFYNRNVLSGVTIRWSFWNEFVSRNIARVSRKEEEEKEKEVVEKAVVAKQEKEEEEEEEVTDSNLGSRITRTW